MKKIFTSVLVAVCIICSLIAVCLGVGCQCGETEHKPGVTHTVNLTASEGIEYRLVSPSGQFSGTRPSFETRMESGTKVVLEIVVDEGYIGTPQVAVNGSSDNVTFSDADGYFRFTVEGDSIVTVKGVYIGRSSMQGNGTSASPYLVTSPADLLYIASQVNSNNEAYLESYYRLENDIDVGGGNLSVIGSGVDDSYFGGSFDGNGHTISNFTIKSNSYEYVGLFGQVTANIMDENLGVITSLTLDNFTIEAQAASGANLYVGAFAGYGIGANVFNCRASNGTINVFADYNSFAFAGGVFGMQQSAYVESFGMSCFSGVNYCSTDLELNCMKGKVLCAGGISGYLLSGYEQSTAYIANSYSEGKVFGAIRSGGIVGTCSIYSSVASCYSTCDVSAYSDVWDSNMLQYAVAYAGGICGYSEADTVISDSFSTSALGADSLLGSSYEKTGGICAGTVENAGDPYVDSQPLVVFNCYSVADKSATVSQLQSVDFLKNTLKWKDCDWLFAEGSYPTINAAENEIDFYVNLELDGETVNTGTDNFRLEISSMYMPICYWYNVSNSASLTGSSEGLPELFIADSGKVSYGYYFDEELKERVPYGYIFTRDVDLYVGFADYSEVAGNYYINNSGTSRKITLNLTSRANFTYTDGGITVNGIYRYDGTDVYFLYAPFARLSDHVETDNEENPMLSWNYDMYNFKGKKTSEGFEIFDNVYFTEDAPLKASKNAAIYGSYYVKEDGEEYNFNADYTGTIKKDGVTRRFSYTLDGETLTLKVLTAADDEVLTGTYSADAITVSGKSLSAYDSFKGAWEKSATIPKRYVFDGKGGWSYSYKGEKKSGTYVEAEGVLTLSSGGSEYGTAKFDASGALSLDLVSGEKALYYRENSYVGVWMLSGSDGTVITLELHGIGSNGMGTGVCSYSDGSYYDITYVADNMFASAQSGDATVVTLYQDALLFGNFYVLQSSGRMVAALYNATLSAIVEGISLDLTDELAGEWISGNADFELVELNGLGAYSSDETLENSRGEITINGETIKYYNYQFAYKGKNYVLSYDDVKTMLTITGGDDERIELIRKDKMYGLTLTDRTNNSDTDYNTYTFNGGGNLESGGKLTELSTAGVEKVYGYKLVGDEIKVYSDATTCLEEYGNIVFNSDKNTYDITLGETQAVSLTLDNPFTGRWAVSGFSSNITINTIDFSYLNGGTSTVTGTFMDMRTTSYVYHAAEGYLTVDYLSGEMTFAVTLYIISVDGGEIVLSSYPYLVTGDYIPCAKVDDFFSVSWTRNNGSESIQFDGMSESKLVYGVAYYSAHDGNTTYLYTLRFGKVYVWNYVPLNGETLFYSLEMGTGTTTEEEGEMVFTGGRNRWLKLSPLENDTALVAKTTEGKQYTFTFRGEVTSSDGDKYTYVVRERDGQTTKVQLTDESGEVLTAIVDYSSAEATITFED